LYKRVSAAANPAARPSKYQGHSVLENTVMFLLLVFSSR
jgi:hypothetical protein